MSLDPERVREAVEQHRDGEAGTHQYDDLAWAARLWLAGTETRWCEIHACAVIRQRDTSCSYFLAASRLSSPKYCRIVPARLFVEGREPE